MSTRGQRLNPFQHAKLRPDAIIGSVKTSKKERWVYDDKNQRFVKKNIKYNPGMLKIVEEIISNAIDNKWRSSKHGIDMKKIEITVDRKTGYITVWNDGYPIPAKQESYTYVDPVTQKTTVDKLYPAELFFGYMLAGTNYQDDEKDRKTSGRNGMGAKATNVFSTHFVVEHGDPNEGKKFIQEFKNNVTSRTKPVLTPYRAKTGYTKIHFHPDFEAFDNYPGIDDDFYSLLKKTAYDCAMITGLNVIFNEEKIKITSLEKYAKLFFPDTKNYLLFKNKNGDETVFIERKTDKEEADHVEHVSFVNGVETRGGGVHVDAWRDAFFPGIVRAFNSRKPKKGMPQLKTTAKQVYPYFVMFMRCEVEQPAFDTQSKETLNSPTPHTVKPNEKEIAKVLKWSFVSSLEDILSAKVERSLNKKETVVKKPLLGNKLTDANWAGTKKGKDCVLLITEGLSAKNLADAGIAAIKAHNVFGAYAIRGKFINVTNATKQEIANNEEIKALKSVIGLQSGVDYKKQENFDRLRYKKVWLFTDADDDGIHIRGLLINFFRVLFPTLIERGDFIFSLSSPVVTFAKGKEVLKFYSNPDFKKWSEKNKAKGVMKYRKGLGAYSQSEAKQVFDEPKTIKFVCEGDEDEKEYLKLAFDDEESDLRKQWITRDMPKDTKIESKKIEETEFTYQGIMTLSEFIENQLIIYHRMVLRRALPSLFDGFKEASRKVFMGIRAENLRKPMIVEQLLGKISSRTCYHHALTALYGTVCGMAQGFVGANNIPLLVADGMMGTRMDGGSSPAAARYPSTMLEDIADALFPPVDEPLLNYLYEDKTCIEPEHYIPILPLILVNGGDGIASGFSTKIPCFNPKDIVSWIRTWLKDEKSVKNLSPLVPWYRGFKGKIYLTESKTSKSWISEGILEKGEKGWWHIKELPVGMSTHKFQEYLESLASFTDKKTGRKVTLISEIQAFNTPNSVHFKIKPTASFIPSMTHTNNFKCLVKKSSMSNFVLLNYYGYPVKYSGPEHILRDFCKVRIMYYEKRKEYLEKQLKIEFKKDTNRYRYIKAVVDGKLDMHQKDDDLEASMQELKLEKMIHGNNEEPSYDYLLSMQMRSMTEKKLEELKKSAELSTKKLKELQAKTAKDLWIEDLDAFEEAYQKFLKTRKDDIDD